MKLDIIIAIVVLIGVCILAAICINKILRIEKLEKKLLKKEKECKFWKLKNKELCN